MIESILFYLFALVAVTAGAVILLTNDIVRMAYLLIGMLLAVAGLYFVLGDPFLGVIQIIVYAGGVAVLMVFGVMLTSKHLAPQLLPSRSEAVWLAAVSLILLIGLSVAVAETPWPNAEPSAVATVADFGSTILERYIGPFELASVLLLVALLGAAYLVRPTVPAAKPGREQSRMQEEEKRRAA
jgi:NADH-quinone oxidoreductase subunit J